MHYEELLRVLRSRQRIVYAVLAVGVLAALIGYKLAKPTFAATSSVLMSAVDSSGSTITNGGYLSNDMPSLLLSNTILSRFVKQEHLTGKAAQFKNLRKAIDAEITPDSAVLPITYKAATAEAAVSGANALATDLATYYRQLSTERYDDLARYLSTALDGERVKIEADDRQLAVLVGSNPYFTQNQAAQAIGAQLLALNQQRDEINATMQSHAVQAQLAGTRMKDLMPTVQAEMRNANPDYSAMASEIAKDKAAEAVLQAQYTNKFAGIQALSDQIARSSAVLQEERRRADTEDLGNSPTYGQLLRDRDSADAIYQGDSAQLAAIEHQIADTEAQLGKLPQIGVQIATLQRDRDAANTAYQILAEQRTLTLSQQAQMAALGSVTVADYATVGEPAVGKIAILVAVAALLAFTVLALALPFGLESIDQRFRRRVTIESLYGRPLIGTVPA